MRKRKERLMEVGYHSRISMESLVEEDEDKVKEGVES